MATLSTKPGSEAVNKAALAAELIAKHEARTAKIAAKRAQREIQMAAIRKVRDARKASGEAMRSPTEKVEDFKRLAKARVPRVVKMIRQVANLANRSSYTYTDEQVAKIMAVLAEAVAYCEMRFAGSEKPSDGFDI